MVMPFIIKLKQASAPTQIKLAYFEARPSWRDFASEIAGLFSISPNNVAVIFIHEAEGEFTLKNEEDLQSFYEVFNPSSGKIKFVVQDLQAPDCESASKRLSLPIIHHSSISPNHNRCLLVSRFQSIQGR
ncbi:hypothetical protein K443DRAFT_681171 [Laccaria amethystina LaAM-08-1]|jgi:hypothetical protein|uniref:PB1 domain-containing protein n=1 Tax=Laccaria amethystina LaAM-08-1 TaxID=1095629 RepID=A0A0C9XPG3_9AGAR|nr:hypothetical protein K443DRAFT_681171 [Laccaria amethystina LaAM-08-1]